MSVSQPEFQELSRSLSFASIEGQALAFRRLVAGAESLPWTSADTGPQLLTACSRACQSHLDRDFKLRYFWVQGEGSHQEENKWEKKWYLHNTWCMEAQ